LSQARKGVRDSRTNDELEAKGKEYSVRSAGRCSELFARLSWQQNRTFLKDIFFLCEAPEKEVMAFL